eukprot:m.26489 g.26489  ORF g.26489 m.26489 type:complete len:385 (-) comp7803_c0_seq1:416-1570(-)
MCTIAILQCMNNKNALWWFCIPAQEYGFTVKQLLVLSPAVIFFTLICLEVYARTSPATYQEQQGSGGSHRQRSGKRLTTESFKFVVPSIHQFDNAHIATPSPLALETISKQDVKTKILDPVVVTPTTSKDLCAFGSQFAKFSINMQTVKPREVVLGSAGLTPMDEACVRKLKGELDVPLRVVFTRVEGPTTAADSRNAALNSIDNETPIFFHDIDEYVHPRWIELGMWAFQTFAESVLIFNYIYGWKHSEPPFCFGGSSFTSVFTTNAVIKDTNSRSTNVKVDEYHADVKQKQSVSKSCCAIVHGYPAMRAKPQALFNLSYPLNHKSGEDGMLLQQIVEQGPNIRYLGFPAMAYRSKLPSFAAWNLTNDKNRCECYGGFGVCNR